jgi:hypothetical protein
MLEERYRHYIRVAIRGRKFNMKTWPFYPFQWLKRHTITHSPQQFTLHYIRRAEGSISR